MASKRNRQRQLERARVERRIARQAHQTRRKRQLQAGISASLALVVIVVGLTWLLGGFEPSQPERQTEASGERCTWHLKDAEPAGSVTDTGHPPTTGEVTTGTETMTIKTNLGEIQATIDLSKVPCTAASFKHLSTQKYYEGSRCHRLDTVGKLLQCGDATGNGSGQPSYTYDDEYLPETPISSPSTTPSSSAHPSASPSSGTGAPATYYAKGTIVMANTGANTNSGQFYIIYDNGSSLGPAYSVVGAVTKGLGFIEQVAKAGALDSEGKPASDGKPNVEVVIEQLYLGAPPSASPSASASAPPSAAPSPSASAPRLASPTPSAKP